jgi:hypothetical protein
MNAWHVERGTIDGTDVSGLTLVALGHVHGHVLQGRPVVYYVDDKATGEQQAALISAWTGQQGGPLADVASLIGEVAGVERALMTFSIRQGKGQLRVGQAIEAVVTRPDVGEHAMSDMSQPHSDICTTLPGEKSQPAQVTTYRVALPSYGFALDLRDYPAIQGRFRFEG